MRTGGGTQLVPVDLEELEIPLSQNRSQQMRSENDWDPNAAVSKGFAGLHSKMRTQLTTPSLFPQVLSNGDILANLVRNESDRRVMFVTSREQE